MGGVVIHSLLIYLLITYYMFSIALNHTTVNGTNMPLPYWIHSLISKHWLVHSNLFNPPNTPWLDITIPCILQRRWLTLGLVNHSWSHNQQVNALGLNVISTRSCILKHCYQRERYVWVWGYAGMEVYQVSQRKQREELGVDLVWIGGWKEAGSSRKRQA